MSGVGSDAHAQRRAFCDRLVELLHDCQAMQSEADLQEVAKRLPPELSRRVPYANNLQKHMLGLVETCVDRRDGIAHLIGAVRFFEGDTDPMRAIDDFLAEQQLAGDVWAQVTVGLGGVGGGARARAAAGVSLLCKVPARTACFVGRAAELDQLEALLTGGSDARIAASVEGLAGIGKTELALQLVYRLAGRGRFPGGIFWFDAEDADLTPTWCTEVADDLGLPAGAIEERARAAVATIKRRDLPTLLVLDNVEAWGRGRTPAPLPTAPHLRWLVTTRSRRLGGARFKHVTVGVLDRGPALDLLEEVSGRELAAAEGTDVLLDHLDGPALALELAGAYLGEFPAEGPAGYLARL
ncbi:effector-associated domain 2-containing protein, partial [Haliangium sp.]|uniref:effector-associated domain 2-containing protein n=1 Tax=Haliangium sp. TaxID=2663208 RepID=UPI003D1340C3